jgi:alanine dehydrogenase
MNISIIGTSQKKHEHRLPLHPGHFARIAPEIRPHLFFEHDYGAPFGVTDAEIASLFGGVMPREKLLGESDLVILAKPADADAAALKRGAILWGWIHCVQNPSITQIAIDHQLTYLTWERMNTWDSEGKYISHYFAENNQIAGYAGVLHALTLRGMEGNYGPRKKIVLINTGQVSTGAMRALRVLGFDDIHVVSQNPGKNPAFEGAEFYQLSHSDSGALQVQHGKSTFALIELLADADVIVNGILQNPLQPLMFVQAGEENRLKRGSLIVDISCDAGMGFPFAAATSFDEPIVQHGDIYYYAVDHTPSLLWQSATWAISKVLLPFLETAVAGMDAISQNGVLRRAMEIQHGKIINTDILAFQKRAADYPHLMEGNQER